MRNQTLIRVATGLLLAAGLAFPQSPSDALIEATKSWLRNVSTGSRAELNASMDEKFLATTPAGDVLSKERLVPSDPSQPVQQLPAMELDAPLARIFAETGVVMSHLKSESGPTLNATFVFVSRQNTWKLAAVHLSPAGR